MRAPQSPFRAFRALTTLPQRRLSQPTSFTHSHLLTATEVTPGIPRSEYQQRRERLSERLPENSLSIIPSNPVKYMSEDVPYLYHHNTDLLYIAGITEPGSLLVAEKGVSETCYTLFVAPRDETRELWEGPLCGTGEEVRAYFGVDEVLPTGELPGYVERTLGNISSFHYDGRINSGVTSLLRNLEKGVLERVVRKWGPSPKGVLAEERLIKSDTEIELMRKSARVMSRALEETMETCRGEVEERVIEARLEYSAKTAGARRMAFPCVVASGTNGTVLHYMANDGLARKGDMVMVDVGCLYHGYCSDVSRSFPVGGLFSGAQRDVYEVCLQVQKDVIGRVKPGISLDDLHIHAAEGIAAGLKDIGFFRDVGLVEVLERGLYSEYFPHAVGHYLGLDVHDTHSVSKARNLEKGMVVTVEPGIYCRAGNVPIGFEDIGIRIEDDVLVTDNGAEVLSDAVKEIDDVEALIKG